MTILDYIVCFVKNFDERINAIGLEQMNEDAIERYKNPDNDPRGVWTSVPAIAQAGHGTKSQFYTLISPKGLKFNPPSGSCWRYTESKMMIIEYGLVRTELVFQELKSF